MIKIFQGVKKASIAMKTKTDKPEKYFRRSRKILEFTGKAA
jgi:hypothetical protein